MHEHADESNRSGSSGAGARSFSWVALCIVAAGMLAYAHQAVVARSVPTEDFGWFGAFWSMSLVIAFGAFLPVELELARLLPRRPARAPLPAGTVITLAGLTVASCATLGLAAARLLPSLGNQASFLVALFALCLVSSGQFLLRGLMLGSGRLGLHGAVLLLDSGLRVGLALVLASLVPHARGADYAWALVAAITVAHFPLLGRLLLRRRRLAHAPGAAPEGAAGPAGSARPFVTAVGHLLVGALCAQMLLNAAPVVVTGFAAPGEAGLAAQFVASYTLVRLPLFVAVPLQSAMIPVLTQIQGSDGGHRMRRTLTRGLAATGVLAVVAGGVGLWLGPSIVGLVFGARYALPGADIAVLAVGSVLHLGLLVGSQTLVAVGRHRQVALVWASGLLVATALFVLVDDLILRASLAFAVGSGVALLVAAFLRLSEAAARRATIAG